MSEAEKQKDQPGQFALALALGVIASALFALPALYNLLVALQEALTTGLVRVSPINRGAPRQWVPWPQAWAYFLGLLLLVVGGFPLFLSLASPRFRRALPLVGQVLAIIAAPVGIPLWLFSGTLVSLSGTLFLCGFFAFIALVAFIGKRFGRVFAMVMLVSVVAVILFLYVRRA